MNLFQQEFGAGEFPIEILGDPTERYTGPDSQTCTARHVAEKLYFPGLPNPLRIYS